MHTFMRRYHVSSTAGSHHCSTSDDLKGDKSQPFCEVARACVHCREPHTYERALQQHNIGHCSAALQAFTAARQQTSEHAWCYNAHQRRAIKQVGQHE